MWIFIQKFLSLVGKQFGGSLILWNTSYLRIPMLDIVTLIVAGLAFLMGYRKGIVKTVFGILSIVLGILIALRLSPFIIKFIEDAFQLSPKWALIIGFIVTLGAVVAVLGYIGTFIEKLLRTIHLNFLNKMLGGVLFALVGLTILGWAFLYLTDLGLIDSGQIEVSTGYPIVTSLPAEAQTWVRDMDPVFEEFKRLYEEALGSNDSE